jgi:SAM-dependent methyltransferase
VSTSGAPAGTYYRPDLAWVHHQGFGFHADACAPGILRLLEPLRQQRGLVVEVGCGTGLLARHLIDAGHRVVATDASPAMIALARRYVPDADDVRPLALPGDTVPEADAIVSVGHALSYLEDEAAIERALLSIARALRPGGIFAIDLCDLEWGRARRDAPPYVRVENDWAIITKFSLPSPNRFVRDITVFRRDTNQSWRRDDEHHENTLMDTPRLPALFDGSGVDVTVTSSFGGEQLPEGLRVLIGRRAPHASVRA